MKFGKTNEQRQAEWIAERNARDGSDMPTRVFAWVPRQRQEDGMRVWLEYVWRVRKRHTSGRMSCIVYCSTMEKATEEYRSWQDIVQRF